MEENKILQLVYTFFLGVLLAVFVGVGINTFYPSPEQPEYPVELETSRQELTPAQEIKEAEYNRAIRNYEEKTKPYNRNVSIITLIAALVFFAISIIYEKRIKVIADGVMLGGLFTLFYSIGRGFASESSAYVFVVVTAGLVVVLYLGYHKFVIPSEVKMSKKK